MKTSVRWLNEYLDPANVTAEGAEEVLTNAGFPIEEAVQLPTGDVMLDVEVTSNRGDCLSHIGLAREIAAGTGRRLRLPSVPEAASAPSDANISQLVRLENRVPEVCRHFTLRVVRGVKVGPSPAWLADALIAVGQRPINNVVDVTNFVLFEYGQPTHAFDLARIAKGVDGVPGLIVRYAANGEKLTLLDGKTITLNVGELVVADAAGPASLAGIMGGRGSEVSDATTDVLLEAATWDALTIRRAARRLQVGTDASYRFERLVDPRTIDLASRRAADLLLKVGGPNARLVPGVIQAGAPLEPPTRVSFRPARCRAILGMDVSTPEIVKSLRAHDVQVTTPPAAAAARPGDEAPLECVIPAHRPDLEREIDLIEEVARTVGLSKIPTLEKLPVRVAAPQVRERAVREMANVLTGLGFYETITFSFVSPADAAPFLSSDMQRMELCDERRKADPVLRPSLFPSLLACRRANQDAGVTAEGGVRLFEVASTFATQGASGVETRVLALYADSVTAAGVVKGFDARQESFRFMRGVIESLVRSLGGAGADVQFSSARLSFSGVDAAAGAVVQVRTASGQTKDIGYCGLVASEVLRSYDLDTSAVIAELKLNDLLDLFPPRSLAAALPQFPGIERDLSFIVPENVGWGAIEQLIASSSIERLDGHQFITTYRGTYRDSQNAEHNLGKQGKKAVTVRLRFRDPSRTLRHDEVDPQIEALVKLAGAKFGAVLRA